MLKEKRNSFITEIQAAIRNNGNISEQAKAYVCEIIPPEVKRVTNLAEFGDIYDSNLRTEKILRWEWITVDKEKFKQGVETELLSIAARMSDDFKNDYVRSLSALLDQVKAEFILNMDKYSILMQAKLADKKAMEELRKKIVSTEDALLRCKRNWILQYGV